MSSYAAITETIGKLKRAAIDAYMHDMGWQVYNDFYSQVTGAALLSVSRPNDTGAGGGQPGGLAPQSLTDSYHRTFNQIRDEIDALTYPWLDLPDPEGIETIIENCRQTTRRLSGTATISDGLLSPAGPMAGVLSLVSRNLESLSGLTIATFKAKFLSQLGMAVSGFQAVSTTRGMNIAAQKGIWQSARADVVNILEDAFRSLDAIGKDRMHSVRTELTVLGWAAKGAAFFSTGGLSASLEAADLGLSLLSETTKDPAENAYAATTYDEAMRGLGTALDQLNGQIKDEERAIAANAEQNLASVRNSKSSYDLTQPPVATSDGIIVLDRPLVDEIVKVYLPEIAAELEDIAAKDRDCDASSRVVRSSELGLSATGPSNSIRELNWQLYKLLKDLAWEVDNGARVLSLAIADLMDEDENAAAELVRLANQIAQGTPTDPWG